MKTPFECACTTMGSGELAVWLDDDGLVRFRAYGVSWRLSSREAIALARDMACLISDGELYDDDHERAVKVGMWDEYSLVLKLDEDDSALILDNMYSEMLADWLEEGCE